VNLVIFDLDGTLARLSHRIAIAGNEPPRTDPAEYQRWLDLLQPPGALLSDPPIEQTVDDYRTAAEYKEFELVELKRHFTGPITVIDDDGAQDCSAIYLKHGALHLMVKGE
jgi:phosphoglycolate phosphatase-like HAD superfamily hydrolase